MMLAPLSHLTIDGAGLTLPVISVSGREHVHEPYVFDLDCPAEDASGEIADIRAEDVITQSASVRWGLPDGSDRTVTGVVESITASGRGWTITIASPLAALADAVDHQVFVDEDAATIAEKVFSEHGIQIERRVTRSLPKRPQCVQAFESDLAFVSRILAEEGVAWLVRPDAADKVVLIDDPSGWDDLPGGGTLPVAGHGGLITDEAVFSARLVRARVPDKLSLRDLDFRKPMVDLTASAGSGPLERYEYPGGYDDGAIGNDLAKIRLEEARGRRVVLHAQTSCPRVVAGCVIELSDAKHGEVNGRWLVIEVHHRVGGAGTGMTDAAYQGRFTAVPAADGHRPARPPRPSLGGVQTVTTTGASGAEIHTEQYGRMKAHLRWDRRRPMDDHSSQWMRVVQAPTSGGFLQPRVGWEALAGFHGASADAPFILGRLYNGKAPPPEGLPGKKVVSTFGSLTTPGGGSGNVISMDDTAGNEGMTFNASKDLNERTENDKKTSVTASDSLTVGANRKVIVGQVHQVGVKGAQSYTVGSTRTVNVDANKAINAASETVMVGGLRMFNVGGDQVIGSSSLSRLVGAAKVETAIEHQKRHVTGASTILVGGSWSAKGALHATVSVGGAHTEVVAGAKSIKTPEYSLKVRGVLNETLGSRSITAGGDRGENFGAGASYTIGGSMNVQGANVVITAKSNITIKAGGLTISITPGSVTIDGDYKSSTGAVEDGKNSYP